jgi:ADP-ribosylglycohydrolase
MKLQQDYAERVYAGVLGKIIGVYLGRPFEGWTYERIMAELGEVDSYVNERLNAPLVVTDDDISGTFAFVRALADLPGGRDITANQIGLTWLNYIIEERTILWWGGRGQSTEHTAYLNLRDGVAAPESGSIKRNGAVVAEQIGAQIFIDGWAMVAPGDPELAAELARKAGSVSHDGEAIYAAQALAAMEALAFVEPDLNTLLDCALRLIPGDCTISRLITDLRSWHATDRDWRATRERIVERYGYGRYPGNVHVVPNHALIILALLYGDGDFRRSLAIVNTCGWDTDCNSGNVGCLLGIKAGLAAFDGCDDLRHPVADRLFVSTAAGGRTVTDAVAEAERLVAMGRRLAAGRDLAAGDATDDDAAEGDATRGAPARGGNGSSVAAPRFHFGYPGSVRGFRTTRHDGGSPVIENVAEERSAFGRALCVRFVASAASSDCEVMTPTFAQPEELTRPGYGLVASPTLYGGQTMEARILAGKESVSFDARLGVRVYGPGDELSTVSGEPRRIARGEEAKLRWTLPQLDGPIADAGVLLAAAPESAPRAIPGTGERVVALIDSLTWSGEPHAHFTRPAHGGAAWHRAWTNGMDRFDLHWREPYHLCQNHGSGIVSTGEPGWSSYRVEACLTTWMAREFGLAARYQGLLRYYALLFVAPDRVALVRELYGRTVLDEAPFAWELAKPYRLALAVTGSRLRGSVDGKVVLEATDGELAGGGIGVVCTEGTVITDAVSVEPA